VIENAANYNCSPIDVVTAYLVVNDANKLDELISEVDALDTKVSWELQHELYSEIRTLTQTQTSDLLRSKMKVTSLESAITAQATAAKDLTPIIQKSLPEYLQHLDSDRKSRFTAQKAVSSALAERVAAMRIIGHIPDICTIAEQSKSELKPSCTAYFAMTDLFKIGRILNAAEKIQTDDQYETLILAKSIDSIRARRIEIAVRINKQGKSNDDPTAAWLSKNQASVSSAQAMIDNLTSETALGNLDATRLAVIASTLQDI